MKFLRLFGVAVFILSQSANTLGCSDLEVGEQLQLELSTSTCFRVPGITTDQYRLTIRNSMYGRYSISEGNVGYAWNAPADGIYYCASGSSNINFKEYVAGATVSITADLVGPNDHCFSDYISLNGFIPFKVPPSGGDTTEVYWSSHRYFLHADHFEYQVQGEADAITMENGSRIDIYGDPGDTISHSIEIYWDIDGLEKRFYADIDASTTDWIMSEVRVYDNTEEWVFFYPDGVGGSLETCFQRSNLVLSTNDPPSEIRFENLTLATFLPWPDTMQMEDCILGALPSQPDTPTPTPLPDIKSNSSGDSFPIGLAVGVAVAAIAVLIASAFFIYRKIQKRYNSASNQEGGSQIITSAALVAQDVTPMSVIAVPEDQTQGREMGLLPTFKDQAQDGARPQPPTTQRDNLPTVDMRQPPPPASQHPMVQDSMAENRGGGKSPPRPAAAAVLPTFKDQVQSHGGPAPNTTRRPMEP